MVISIKKKVKIYICRIKIKHATKNFDHSISIPPGIGAFVFHPLDLRTLSGECPEISGHQKI